MHWTRSEKIFCLGFLLSALPSFCYAQRAQGDHVNGYVCDAATEIRRVDSRPGSAQEVAIANNGVILLGNKFPYNDRVMAQFIISHECAHLGGIEDEDGADCDAARVECESGRLKPAALNHVLGIVQKMHEESGDTWHHSQGPERARKIRACAQDAGC